MGSKKFNKIKSLLRVRISDAEAHYGGKLASGAKIMELFGDVATELCILNDGDEGLFRAYKDVEFLVPVKAGDYLEVTGQITNIGHSSRTMKFEAHKVILRSQNARYISKARVLKKPVLVAKATGTCVVKKKRKG